MSNHSNIQAAKQITKQQQDINNYRDNIDNMYCDVYEQVYDPYYKLVRCPFCNVIYAEEKSCYIDDEYGKYASIYCGRCRIMSVIDYEAENNIDKVIDKKYYIKKVKLITKLKYKSKPDEIKDNHIYKKYRVKMFKILRTAGNNIIEVKNKLTDEEVFDVYNNSEYIQSCDFIIPPHITEKYNILSDHSYENRFCRYSDLKDADIEKGLIDGTILSLPVYNYNLFEYIKEYPKNFRMNNDGIYLHMLLEGNKYAYLSGD